MNEYTIGIWERPDGKKYVSMARVHHREPREPRITRLNVDVEDFEAFQKIVAGVTVEALLDEYAAQV